MIREQMSFNDALQIAQKLGYAERNPAADIEGIDTCRKICILASLAYGTHVYPDTVHTEGITGITSSDVEYAFSWGGVIKLIGHCRKLENGKLEILVCPMFISHESQLSSVDDEFNGIMVRGDETGDVVFYGKGAGKLPTASAVVADVIDCVKHLKARKYLFWEDAKPDYIEDISNYCWSFFLRVLLPDGKKDDETEKHVFKNIEYLSRKNQPDNEKAFVTEKMTEAELKDKVNVLNDSGIKVESVIRIAEF
jgi:homoserine dehydrogenase